MFSIYMYVIALYSFSLIIITVQVTLFIDTYILHHILHNCIDPNATVDLVT